MGWDKHEEVKLAHEVKQEVGFRGEVRHFEKSSHCQSVIFREAVV